jgi:hypothetical protein
MKPPSAHGRQFEGPQRYHRSNRINWPSFRNPCRIGVLLAQACIRGKIDPIRLILIRKDPEFVARNGWAIARIGEAALSHPTPSNFSNFAVSLRHNQESHVSLAVIVDDIIRL